jgi:TrmH family RNA methyltransferase
VEEAVERGLKIEYLIINETIKDIPLVNYSGFVLRLKNSLFKNLSETVNSQGILAVIESINVPLSKVNLDKNPFIVVLDAIQDPGNMGTIIRTAAAAKSDAIILTHGSVELYNPKVIRSTMGSLFQVPIVHRLDDNKLIKWLQVHRINIVVADLHSEEYHYSADLRKPLALVIGNENKGPGLMWKRAARKIVKIPIPGMTESLNAAVAAGILIYEVVRQRFY